MDHDDARGCGTDTEVRPWSRSGYDDASAHPTMPP